MPDIGRCVVLKGIRPRRHPAFISRGGIETINGRESGYVAHEVERIASEDR